jgi:hypothetical protein
MYNKKLLSKIDLGKYNKPNPYSKDIIIDPQGQYNHPGVPTRIPSSDITMKGVGYPVLGIADNGQKQMMQPGQDYKFPGAKYVDEYPQMKKGGGLNSKKYTRSLEGVGELFRESALFKKPKSKKKKLFHPNAKYFQDGGITSQEEMDAANDAMMKARLAYAQMHGNPAAQRMVVAPDQPYDFGNGVTGTHYMASMDNYAVPQIQDVNGQLMLGDYGPESAEAMRFDNPEDAMYFAENYKKVTPDESYRKEYQMGGATCPPGYEFHELTGECILKNPYDVNRIKSPKQRQETIKETGFAFQVDKNMDYYRDYMNSPRYREMIINSAGPAAYRYTLARKNNLESIPSVKLIENLRSSDGDRVAGLSYNADGRIEIDKNLGYSGTVGKEQTIPHEFSHSTDRPINFYTNPGTNAIYKKENGVWYISNDKTGNKWQAINDAEREYNLQWGATEFAMDRVIPPKDEYKINTFSANSFLQSPQFQSLSADQKKNLRQRYNTDPEFKKAREERIEYLSDPTETRARLNAARYAAKGTGIYDPFTEKITKKKYQQLLDNDAIRDLKEIYTDEQIIEMLNTISKNQEKVESPNQLQTAKYGKTLKSFAPGGVASPKDLDPEHMKRYLADLRMQENNIRKGYRNGMWYPHASVEGGADTIAYGHKLTPNDSALRRGITEDQALKLQEQDVLKNQALAKKQVDKKYGTGTFDNLPQDSQMLLVDYQYNLGTLSEFPKFVKGVVEGNKEQMLAQHTRYGAGKPLTKRNDWTVNVINNLEIPKPYDPMKEVTVPLANVPDATSVVQPDFLQGPTAVELPPQKYQGGGVVELNGNQYVKNPANGNWTFTSGAPVTDVMTLQKLNYGEGKPVGSPVVQEAPGRQKAKENIVAASKNVKPPQPIERNVPRGNVSDATTVVQPFIPKPSFVDQPGPAKSLADSQKLLQDEAQRLITSGAARDMGVTAKYLSPQNANSANPKSLQQLMIEEMTKKDFQKRLDQARLNQVNKKWNQSSILGKAGDVTRSFLADPINVTEEAIWGDQYLPDRANILRDPRNPLNAYYRKETGYDNSGLNNMVSIINPFSSAADATVYARQGNLLGTAKEFGEGLLKAAVITRAPGALNALMSRRVSLGALGATDVGTLAGATGVASGTLALPTTAKALYKAGETGNKEDIRAAVNQAGMNALDFIAPEVIGSKGALSALMKGEKLTPLQQLSRQNILTGSTANNLNDLRLSTPALDNALDISRNIRSYREQSAAPAFASLEDGSQSQLMDLMNNRREVDRTIQELRNQGNTNSPYFQGAIDERDYLTRQIDDLNTQTRDRIATQAQSTISNQINNANIPSQPISNVNLTVRRNEINDLTRRLRNESGTDSPFYRAAVVEKSRIDSKIAARRDYMRASFGSIEADLSQDAARIAEARNKLQVAEENLKINDPAYYQQLVPPTQPTITGSFDLTRPTPGVTEYGSNLPAPVRTSQVYEEMGSLLGNPNLAPIEFSDATRQALRERNGASRMTLEAQLRTASDPIDFVNRLRNQFANGNINRQTYDELVGGLKNVVNPKSDAYEDFDFFEEIATANPNKPYTGSMLLGHEVLDELKSIPKEELENVLRDNYGYGADDYSFIFNNTGISDEMAKIAMNQILDDYTFASKYNITNPHAPAIDFFSRQTIAPQLKSNSNDLGILNLSPKTLDIIEKTKYGNKSQTTGRIIYNRTDLDYKDLPTISDKKYIINNKEIDEQLQVYEEAYSKIPKGSTNPIHKDIQNRLEDLRSTKWLRTEYAAELKAAGLNPSEIENITVISSGTNNSKSLVNKDGKVIATLDFDAGLKDGRSFSEISQTGVPQIFHSYNLKSSGFKNWDEAQDAITKRYISEGLDKVTAKNKAATKIAFLQNNNNNKIGEALYRGVHHGIKDTRGGIATKQFFAETKLADPITKNIIARYRARDYWNSQMKQINEKGIAKAGYDPNMTNSPIFVLRKKGGDVPKLLRFTQ